MNIKVSVFRIAGSRYLFSCRQAVAPFKMFSLLLMVGCGFNVSAGEVKFVTFEFPPYTYLDETKKPKGFFFDIVQEMGKVLKRDNADLKVGEIQVFPFKRAFEVGQTEKNTLLFPMGTNKEREQIFDWVGPKFSRQVWVFALKENKGSLTIKSIGDLKGKTIGVTTNYAWKKDILDAGAIPEEGVDDKTVVRKLLAGRSPFIAIDEFALKYVLNLIQEDGKKLTTNDFRKVLLLTTEGSRTFGILKGSDPKVVSSLQKAFGKIEKNGTIEKLKKEYL